MAVYGITENNDLELSQLVAQEGAIMKPVVLKADCGDLSRGAVIERTGAGTGLWQEVSIDGGGDAAGILAEAVTNNADRNSNRQRLCARQIPIRRPDLADRDHNRESTVGSRSPGRSGNTYR